MSFSVSADVPDELLELLVLMPDDTPVTSAEARERGIGYPQLRALVRRGLVRRPVHGVYAVASLPDDLAFRVSVLKLMVPDSCVVTDRTAGWLWGANMILAPQRPPPDAEGVGLLSTRLPAAKRADGEW